jgi:predicted esterase
MAKELLIITLILNSFSFNANVVLKTFNKNHYYITEGKVDKYLIFLHGGMSNPLFDRAEIVSFDDVLGSESFIHLLEDKNIGVLCPIKNSGLNWLEKTEESYQLLLDIIDSENLNMSKFILSGHSDGGTAAYKMMFLDLANIFESTIIFNGFPQYKNFNTNISKGLFANKKIVFVSTFKDNVIPYEFVLDEYTTRKKDCLSSFIFIFKGNHEMSSYARYDLDKIFDEKVFISIDDKLAIHGETEGKKLINFYKFRRKILLKYNFGLKCYEYNKFQRKVFFKSRLKYFLRYSETITDDMIVEIHNFLL